MHFCPVEITAIITAITGLPFIFNRVKRWLKPIHDCCPHIPVKKDKPSYDNQPYRCVRPEAKITMSDGSYRCIKDIKVGELVLGVNNAEQVVSIVKKV